MKSAFAVKQTETYMYPKPLERDSVDPMGRRVVDDEVMQAIEDGDDAPTISIRVPHSTGDANAVAEYLQGTILFGGNGSGRGVQPRIVVANRGLFDLLVEKWSLTERKPTSEDYDRLDRWVGDWVNACIADVLSKGTPADFPSANQSSSSAPDSSPEVLSPVSTSD